MIYDVDLILDENNWWVASVRGVAGCRTQGRSIRQAMTRAREALETCETVRPDAELRPHAHLPAPARTALEHYLASRRRLEKEQLAAREAADAAVQALLGDLNLSVRDTGDLLGLSHQRIHQVARARS